MKGSSKTGDQIYLLCAIWYNLYNLKNVKSTLGGVRPATLLKVSLFHALLQKSYQITTYRFNEDGKLVSKVLA